MEKAEAYGRGQMKHLSMGFHTMSSFMNQAAQRDVMHFITDCLRTQPCQLEVGGVSSS